MIYAILMCYPSSSPQAILPLVEDFVTTPTLTLLPTIDSEDSTKSKDIAAEHKATTDIQTFESLGIKAYLAPL